MAFFLPGKQRKAPPKAGQEIILLRVFQFPLERIFLTMVEGQIYFPDAYRQRNGAFKAPLCKGSLWEAITCKNTTKENSSVVSVISPLKLDIREKQLFCICF